MSQYTGLEIAVIGMAGKFPGAGNVRTFWENLANGVESITVLHDEDIIREKGVLDGLNSPAYVKANSFVEGKENFDAAFFGYRPEEASLMDPQIRVFHEICWQAIEDSGYNIQCYDDKIGLFAGGNVNLSWQAYAAFANRNHEVDDFTASLLRNINYLCSTVAYRLNLTGPVCFVNTACSTSLVAIQQACVSLLLRDCKMALAGGVTINNHTYEGYEYQEGMIYSRDGHCRPFDRDASGTVGAEGCGVVVLKRLEDARKDGDHIYAIIKGGAVNNDGHEKVSFTAPSANGQYKVIAKALKTSRVEPHTISCIEAHGTGTGLGDPIEVEALNNIFGKSTVPFCALGSLKSNVGHMDAAAGVGGFIKMVLSLHHRKLPPTLHYKSPNPGIDFNSSALYVNTTLREWKHDKHPLRAGISSFGIGGTNAHIIVEEAPVRTSSSSGKPVQVMVFSAKTPSSLKKQTEQFSDFLISSPDINLADAAYTLQTGRVHFPYRKALVCTGKDELIASLQAFTLPAQMIPVGERKRRKIVFVFPGQGAQYKGMFHSLFRDEAIFRNEVQECLTFVREQLGTDLESVLFPQTEQSDAAMQINQTAYTQPCLFIVEYALARLIMYYGLQPDAMIGHSIGEYTAACISGIFSREDCLRLVVKRGQLMQDSPKGTMLSVSVDTEGARELLQKHAGVSLAAVNSQQAVVFAGTAKEIAQLQTETEALGYTSKQLNTSHAFHSAAMDGILEEFTRTVRQMQAGVPAIPVISNLTGAFLTQEEAIDPVYWSKHLRETVQFSACAGRALNEEDTIFIEVGPGKALSGFIKLHPNRNASHIILTAGKHSQEEGTTETQALYGMLGDAWAAGAPVDWSKFHDTEERHKIPLPAYPFKQEVYPVNVNMSSVLAQVSGNRPDLKTTTITDWYYQPSWELASLIAGGQSQKPEKILLYHTGMKVTECLQEKLRGLGAEIAVVCISNRFEKRGHLQYVLNPLNEQDIQQLFQSLANDNFIPGVYLHAPGNDQLNGIPADVGDYKNDFYFFLHMVRSALQQPLSAVRKIILMTQDLHPVLDNVMKDPSAALIAGLLKVLPQENPSLSASHIDISLAETFSDEISMDACFEILSERTGQVITYRHGKKWERTYYKAKCIKDEPGPFCQKGVYLITGGLGVTGCLLAEHLLTEFHATVVLCGRTELPVSTDNAHSDSRNTLLGKWEHLQQLAATTSGQIQYHTCNIAHLHELKVLVNQVTQFSGKIEGVFHTAGQKPGIELRLISELSKEETEQYLEAKVTGVHNLYSALQNIPTGFVMLFSSIAAQLGGLGFGAYASANNYMDYFVAAQKSRGFCKNWVSINLDGLDTDHEYAPVLIGKKEFIDAIRLAHPFTDKGRVIISTRDLAARIKDWISRPGTETLMDENNFSSLPDNHQAHLLPALHGPAGQNPVQEKMVQLWTQFFGRDTVGLQDDFFDIGGDSLKALTFLKRIQKAFGIDISIKDFYANANIASLSERIHQVTNRNTTMLPDNAGNLPRAPEKEMYQLSPAQLRMYFLQELDKESVAYNLTHAVLLQGDISSDKISDAFTQLIRNHEILRTSIVTDQGEVRQRIMKDFSFILEEIKSNGQTAEQAIAQFARPFDLSQGPLIRAGLLRLSPVEVIMVVDMHHIVTDGISFKILISDFIKAYTGRGITVSQIQYKDYAEWRQTESQQSRMALQKVFWVQEFSDEVSPLELPYDFPRPAVKSSEGALYGFTLSNTLVQELRQYAARQNTSLFMLLFATYYILLSKLSNSRDIVVGTVTTGREHADLEHVMGMFVNTLPVRNYPDGALRFPEFLQQVNIKTLTAIDNQDYPYYELLDELQLVRDNGRNPLFDTMFVYENADSPVFELPGLTISGFQTGLVMAKFDLLLTAAESAGGMDLTFEYCKALFKEETISSFADGFTQILKQIVEDPTVALHTLRILNDQQEQMIASLLDYTDVNSPTDKTIIQLFDEQVARTPGHIALTMGDQQLSYRELNDKATRLGVLLLDQGIKPDTLVGVLMDKSIPMVIGILGILKAGAAYLPLDTAYPNDRISFLLQDSGAKALIIGQGISSVSAFSGMVITYSEAILQQADPSALAANYLPEHLAYVIYTSGTTGNPKGVMIENRNVVRLLFNEKFQFEFNDRDVWTLFHSQCFDFSVWEIFGALLYGGRLVIISKDTARDTTAFARVLVEEQVTVLNQTPGAFYQLQEEIFHAGIRSLSLRYVIFGGEALSPGKLQQWVNNYPGIRMINMFGITETTVHVTYKEIRPAVIAQHISNVGTPIPTLSVYLLDPYQQLVPRGTIGEICVGGAGVARGYLNRPELTAAKFIANPFRKGDRLYRSGDLGRLTPQGDIEYLGRMDHQVKIRGHRIELGEIEHQIRSFPGIKEAVVLAPYIKGTKQLVAYFVSGINPDIGGMRAYLQNLLPVYMIPAYFMQVPLIPLNANGKVDRKKLPLPEAAVQNDYVAPESTEEKLLASIWENVLGLTRAGMNDNFFAAGGDSIKSIQIIARVRTAGYALTVKDIFTGQTIRYLAGVMKPLRQISTQEIIFGEVLLSPVQEWFFAEPRIAYHHFNQSVLLRFSEDIPSGWIRKIFQQLIQHHDVLRMVFKPGKQGWVAVCNDIEGTHFTLDETDLSAHIDPIGAMQLQCDHIQQSFNLQEGPLVKLAWFRLGSHGYRLLVVVHHLVIDGISWRILFEDIQDLFSKLKQNEVLLLPPKTDSYRDWTKAIRDYTNTRFYRDGLAYWRKVEQKSAGLLPGISPTRGKIKDLLEESFVLDEVWTRRLLKDTNQAFNTNTNDLLLASLCLTLYEEYKLPSVAIIMEGHGREELFGDLVVNRTLGWFTNLFPFILSLPVPGADLSDWIRYSKEAFRSIPNKGMDYLIAAYVQKDIKPSGAEICFNYLGQFDADISGTDFAVSDEFNGHNKSTLSSAEYLLEFSALVSGGKFRMQLFYDSLRISVADVKTFLTRYQNNLMAMVDYCANCKRNELTPADLTYAQLTISQLDQLQQQAPVQDVYPLTPMQEGLLFHSLVNEESNAYFEQMTYRWEGKLDKQALIRTMQQLAQRHDVLRTSFVHKGLARPLQVVWKKKEPVLRFIDKYEQKSGATSLPVTEIQLADRKEGFDIGGTDLLRLTVFRSAENTYHFIWSHHHILMDGWCMGLIVQDFAALYKQELTGIKAELHKNEPYSGYIQWLQQQDPVQSSSYWQNYLSGYQNRLVFPQQKKKKPVTHPDHHSTLRIELGEELTAAIKSVSTRYSVTVNMVMQALWGIQLCKYNNVSDVVFGAVVSGRPAIIRGIEQMVGLFINTIPVRIQYKKEDSFSTILSRVKEDAMTGEPYHYHPLAEIQSLSELKTDLINHILVFENYPLTAAMEETADAAYTITDLDVFEQTNYDLSVMIIPGSTLTVIFHYNEAVFDNDSVHRIASHFRFLAAQCTTDPERIISATTLLSKEEKERLFSFNPSPVSFDISAGVIELFEEQVSLRPDFTAIQFRDQALTYRALNALADGLALQIQSKATVNPNDVIALMSHPSAEMIVMMIAILKLGCTYVSLSPDTPAVRNKAVCSDAAPRLLLLHRDIKAMFNAEEWPLPLNQILEVDLSSITPATGTVVYNRLPSNDSLIYLLYTSGTTGTPKGVQVRTAGILNMIHFYAKAFQVHPGTRISQIANILFDASAFEIWPCLAKGGALHIAPAEERMDAGLMEKWLISEAIQITFQPPAIAELLLRKKTFTDASHALTVMNVAGDVFNYTRQEPLPFHLYNLYGPTEDSVWTTWKEIVPGTSPDIYSIGTPIANRQLFILDDQLQLVPVGCTGELYISGAGLAKGYMHNDQLNREKFISNPYLPGQRMYRTGDLARWTVDGEIQFIGRSDLQVKIRGFRIEIGEIEAALYTCAGIQQAAIVALENNDQKYLVAYYTAGSTVIPGELKASLAEKLPAYMVPSFFMQLEKLPLNQSGKIDRKALPAPVLTKKAIEPLPDNKVYRSLIEIWASILGLDAGMISVSDNFFDIGGNSIKLMQMVNEVNIRLNASITVAAIFKYPYITRIAAYITGKNETPDQTAPEKDQDKMKNTLNVLQKLRQKQ